jgi:enterochelin esterase family protein
MFLVVAISSCKKDDDIEPDNNTFEIITEFASYTDFVDQLSEYALLEPETTRDSVLSIFFDSLEANNKIPYTESEFVAFVYYGSGNSVTWAGDFNGWNSSNPDWSGERIGTSKVWLLEKTFPSDARLDYKIVVDGNWKMDPLNNYFQYGGFGSNSELRMPDWVFPEETILWDGVQRGTLSDNQIIASSHLGYDLQYKVYTPFGYDALSNLPVIYVTDGHEYADPLLGAMLIVMDNLIHTGDIEPVIAVFIDPRNPNNLSENRRADQYRSNPDFAFFVANELVPEIDASYKTNTSANARAILGTSYGGWNSAWFGLTKSEVFGLIGIHSPAFDISIVNGYANTDLLPLKIYMSTGVIYDTQDNARALKTVLEQKGYPFQYKEVNEGHSWGNWRALIDEPLMYFFGN